MNNTLSTIKRKRKSYDLKTKGDIIHFANIQTPTTSPREALQAIDTLRRYFDLSDFSETTFTKLNSLSQLILAHCIESRTQSSLTNYFSSSV